jgi:hypothetical protein
MYEPIHSVILVAALGKGTAQFALSCRHHNLPAKFPLMYGGTAFAYPLTTSESMQLPGSAVRRNDSPFDKM